MVVRCKNGHPATDANTRRHKRSDGYSYLSCAVCNAERERLRYKTNPEYRERSKARALQRYHQSRQNLNPPMIGSPPNSEPIPEPLP